MVATAVANQGATFSITDTKLYVLVVTLSTQDNAKLLKQQESGFKRTINWNKYQSKRSIERPNPYLDYLIDPRFQGTYRLLFYHLKIILTKRVTSDIFPTAEITGYNVMIDGQTSFDQPIKNDARTYDNIQIISTGQGDDSTTDCLLDYNYFKDYYRLKAKQ